MKQGILCGATAGLRPSQRRRLEELCHRRHPVDALADLACLQRLGEEGKALEQPLTLVVDERGLGRLLWVGPLATSGRLLERLPGSLRRQGSDLRLLTCSGSARHPDLTPGTQEAVVGLDLGPRFWLRWARESGPGGQWPAALWLPSLTEAMPWSLLREDDLRRLCAMDPDDLPQREQAGGRVGRRDRGGGGPTPERVLLLALGGSDRIADAGRITELEGLVRSAGAVPVGVVEQRRSSPAPGTIWGEGKVREAALEARRLGADRVVTDRDLTPVQGRNLERLLDLPVSDRSELILDIFAQRAASAAGRLQVELAQLRYRLPRLSGSGTALSRLGGGIGTRGPGETQLEKDRRAIARRIERLQRELKRLGAHRERLRSGRRGLTRVALVGYTNAGKSSLLNALTHVGAEGGVEAEDKLFATLDPTTRRLTLPALEGVAGRTLLLTDTVGFIRDLPAALLEAFRSTIEEALDADGLLIVVNLADPTWPEQLRAVRSILRELGADLPWRVIGNQIDRCPAGELERARTLEAGMLFISATAGLGLQHLRHQLRQWPPPAGAAIPTGPEGAVPTSQG